MVPSAFINKILSLTGEWLGLLQWTHSSPHPCVSMCMGGPGKHLMSISLDITRCVTCRRGWANVAAAGHGTRHCGWFLCMMSIVLMSQATLAMWIPRTLSVWASQHHGRWGRHRNLIAVKLALSCSVPMHLSTFDDRQLGRSCIELTSLTRCRIYVVKYIKNTCYGSSVPFYGWLNDWGRPDRKTVFECSVWCVLQHTGVCREVGVCSCELHKPTIKPRNFFRKIYYTHIKYAIFLRHAFLG